MKIRLYVLALCIITPLIDAETEFVINDSLSQRPKPRVASSSKTSASSTPQVEFEELVSEKPASASSSSSKSSSAASGDLVIDDSLSQDPKPRVASSSKTSASSTPQVEFDIESKAVQMFVEDQQKSTSPSLRMFDEPDVSITPGAAAADLSSAESSFGNMNKRSRSGRGKGGGRREGMLRGANGMGRSQARATEAENPPHSFQPDVLPRSDNEPVDPLVPPESNLPPTIPPPDFSEDPPVNQPVPVKGNVSGGEDQPPASPDSPGDKNGNDAASPGNTNENKEKVPRNDGAAEIETETVDGTDSTWDALIMAGGVCSILLIATAFVLCCRSTASQETQLKREYVSVPAEDATAGVGDSGLNDDFEDDFDMEDGRGSKGFVTMTALGRQVSRPVLGGAPTSAAKSSTGDDMSEACKDENDWGNSDDEVGLGSPASKPGQHNTQPTKAAGAVVAAPLMVLKKAPMSDPGKRTVPVRNTSSESTKRRKSPAAPAVDDIFAAIGIEAAPKFQKTSSVGSSMGISKSPPAVKASSSVSAISSLAVEDGNGGAADWGDELDLSGED